MPGWAADACADRDGHVEVCDAEACDGDHNPNCEARNRDRNGHNEARDHNGDGHDEASDHNGDGHDEASDRNTDTDRTKANGDSGPGASRPTGDAEAVGAATQHSAPDKIRCAVFLGERKRVRRSFAGAQNDKDKLCHGLSC